MDFKRKKWPFKKAEHMGKIWEQCHDLIHHWHFGFPIFETPMSLLAATHSHHPGGYDEFMTCG